MSTTVEVVEEPYWPVYFTRYLGPAGPEDRRRVEITIRTKDGERVQVSLPWPVFVDAMNELIWAE